MVATVKADGEHYCIESGKRTLKRGFVAPWEALAEAALIVAQQTRPAPVKVRVGR